MSKPIAKTPDNSWKVVTAGIEGRNGPCLKRIGVPGGWLYITEHRDNRANYGAPIYGDTILSSPVFVQDDRS